MENSRQSSVILVAENWLFVISCLLVIFAEIRFCPSINLEQLVMVLVLFLTYQLRCGMCGLILSVPLSLLALKEKPGKAAFCTAAFLFNILCI